MPSKPPPGFFRILYFAAAASFTKKGSEDLPAPLEMRKLFDLLDEKYPNMKFRVLSSCAVTVNLNYVDLNDDQEDGAASPSISTLISEGDEVAIIPPVSSG